MIQKVMRMFGYDIHYCEVYDRKTGNKAGKIYRYLKTKGFQSK